MSWVELLWPEKGTLPQRLFRLVAVVGGACLVVSQLLPGRPYSFPAVHLLLALLSSLCLLLFLFLASHLLKQAAARHSQPGWPAHLLRLGSVLLLLLGIGQVVVLAFFLLLLAIPFEFEPRADGDSFFG